MEKIDLKANKNLDPEISNKSKPKQKCHYQIDLKVLKEPDLSEAISARSKNDRKANTTRNST